MSRPSAQFDPNHPLHQYPKLEAGISKRLGLTEEMAGIWISKWSDQKWNTGDHIVVEELAQMYRDLKYKSDLDKFLNTPGFTKLKSAVRNAKKGQ